MASLKKRGKAYYAQYYVNGKQVRKNLQTESLQIAREKLRAIESAQFRQEDIPLPTKSPIGEILDKYITYLKGRTKDKNVQKVTTYLRSTFGPVCDSLKLRNKAVADKAVKRPGTGPEPRIIEITHLEQLTTAQVSEFLSRIVQIKKVSGKTANHYRQNLVTLCNWCMREGGVKFPGGINPVVAVRCYKVPKKSITFLKLNEIRNQLEFVEGDLELQTMVAVYIYAGLRREEALWLTRDDIEWDWGQFGAIWVRAKVVNGEEWAPKTREDRIVPVSRQLRPYLDRYRKKPSRPCIWLFPSPEGQRWDTDNFSARLREANMKNGLPWSCLDFRHTFGSQLAMKGESLFKISQLMGNSPEICRKHYARLMPESLMDSVDFPDDKKVVSSSTPEEALVKQPRLRLVVSNG